MTEKKAENKILFKKYNDAINQTFFDGRFANKPVFLDIEGKIQKEITERLDIEIYDLEEKLGNIISDLLFETSILNPYEFFIEEQILWNRLLRNYNPPFTALLCLFSMAAENMRTDGNYTSSNYYERLFQLLSITDERKKKQRNA